MMFKSILLFIVVPLALAKETPLIQNLPEKHFTASSSYNDTVKASNVRFATKAVHGTISEEPWCPATREDYDYHQEYVTVDLGCPRTIRSVEGKDPYLLFYSSQYSNNKKKWRKLASDDETRYDKNLKMFEANHKAVITPPVRARFFRFRTGGYTYSDERGFQPCIKAELYSETCELCPLLYVPSDPEDSVEPMGCFTEKSEKQLLPVVYHTVQARIQYPDILAIYEECRQKAAEYSTPLEIFGVMNYNNSNKCVTTETGKGEEYFQNARRSRKCKECFGRGIGARKTAVFVYKIKF